MHVRFRPNASWWPANIGISKIFKLIEPSKEERIQSVLPKPDCPLTHLIPSLAIETANR